ncbi:MULTISPECIES: hypothetical protein [unclassified Rubrivivax]|uniref:hypothetical protein n=1 Tax=unclassified Rubrivivax TaxID=2649762 RepID=UPI001E641947|nr:MULTISPECIES: hypothetical protein [unclassified Rubrivivax]MCC9597475.1 hypothetical protein [Rubrivivax sp. JA1055]MCC9646267.1 hypothetical protein [Rubrivivax sp. JA1029]
MTPNADLPRSRFADASAARQAVDCDLPLIEPALHDSDVSGLGVLHPARTVSSTTVTVPRMEHAAAQQRSGIRTHPGDP